MRVIGRTIRHVLKRRGYQLVPIDTPSLNEPVRYRGKLTLPTVPLARIVQGGTKIAIVDPSQVDGNVSITELLVINTLVSTLNAQAVFEIGTFDGRTTANIAANMSPSGTIYTLDLPEAQLGTSGLPLDEYDRQFIEKPTSGIRFRGTPLQDKIVQLFGDSARFEYDAYRGQMDCVFIDGSHSYEYVKSDTKVALDLMKSSGYILWHDYHPFWEGVVRAIHEFHEQGGIFANLKWVQDTSLAVLPLGNSRWHDQL